MFMDECRELADKLISMLNARPMGVPIESYREEIATELQQLAIFAYREGL